MEEENPPPDDLNDPPIPRATRPVCPGCTRPVPVCLCKFLPTRPVPTQTRILILQHPHEARHKLSTTPLLTRCLANATSVPTRRLRRGLHPVLDQSPPATCCFLFPPSPTRPAVPITRLTRRPDVIIAFDATWTHAREMVAASEPYLASIGAVRVCLDEAYDEGAIGASIYDSALALRKEPCGGCVCTAEAVARALGVWEGRRVEEVVVGALKEMVRLQAQYLKPMKPRPKLEKKKKGKGKECESEGV